MVTTFAIGPVVLLVLPKAIPFALKVLNFFF
jgi:hypothetical protein